MAGDKMGILKVNVTCFKVCLMTLCTVEANPATIGKYSCPLSYTAKTSILLSETSTNNIFPLKY